MKRLWALRTGLAYRAGALCCVVVTVMSGAALAQTTGMVNPSPVAAEPAAKEEPPPGGCMPIGLTASGEIVFPFQCKAFIELQKAASQKPVAAEQKPDAAEEKTVAKQPAVTEKPAIAEAKPAAAEEEPAAAEEKTAAKQEDSVAAESKLATATVDAVSLPKRVEREARERAIGPPGCTHFRSYDAISGSYRAFDGQRRQCREVAGQLVPKEVAGRSVRK